VRQEETKQRKEDKVDPFVGREGMGGGVLNL